MLFKRPPTHKILLQLLSFFLLLNCLFFYGFIRDGLWAAIAVALLFVSFRIGTANFLTVALSFTAVTGACLIGASLWDLDERIYNNPGSRLTSIDSDGLPIFKKSTELTLLQPFGDLKRIAPPELAFDLAPRQMHFKTDSFGFRNDDDYHGQRYVLVGDSFILGSGNTQADNLTGQLKRDYGADTYNLAFPTDIKGYFQNIEKFRDQHGEQFRVILFLYEGNDFTEKEKTMEKLGYYRFKWTVRQWVRAYKRIFWNTNLYRYTFFAYSYLMSDLKKENQVEVLALGEKKVAINRAYTETARRTEYHPPSYFEKALGEVKPYIEHIVFIPTKYRVLQNLVGSEKEEETLPDLQWQETQRLGQLLNLPVTNLTPALQQAAHKEFEKEGALLFWTDDTHWNAKGIAVAAREVCQSVPGLNCRAFSPSPVSDAKGKSLGR